MSLTKAAPGHVTTFEPEELIRGEVAQIAAGWHVIVPGECGRIHLRCININGNLSVGAGTELIVHGEIFIGGKTQCAERASVSRCDGCQRCHRD